MTAKNLGDVAYVYDTDVVDEWDEDTISELIPVIDSERELANKNREIARLRTVLDERNQKVKAMAQALEAVGAPKRRFYLIDLLMLIIAAIFVYAQLK